MRACTRLTTSEVALGIEYSRPQTPRVAYMLSGCEACGITFMAGVTREIRDDSCHRDILAPRLDSFAWWQRRSPSGGEAATEPGRCPSSCQDHGQRPGSSERPVAELKARRLNVLCTKTKGLFVSPFHSVFYLCVV